MGSLIMSCSDGAERSGKGIRCYLYFEFRAPFST